MRQADGTYSGDRSPAAEEALPVDSVSPRLFATVRGGLDLLWRASVYAGDMATDRWDFALEIGDLLASGLSRSDLRWMLRKGYLLHARDIGLAGDPERTFRPMGGSSFTRRSCFVLTDLGAQWLAGLRASACSSREGHGPFADQHEAQERIDVQAAARWEMAPGGRGATAWQARPPMPRWDGDLQELSLGSVVIKRFKVPAPNQEMVLAAFEEEGWPPRIDDPLPPQPDQDPKRRLHDTIISLNRNHKALGIRFMGDGSGQGVRWTRVDPAAAQFGSNS